MIRICPNPGAWHEAFERISAHAQLRSCTPPNPPKPLILAGWAYSNDIEKMQRWEETVAWAEINGCSNLLQTIPDSEFYHVEEPTNYTVGPLGGPMFRSWDYEVKNRPSAEQIEQIMQTLLSHWPEIVGNEIASVTRPLALTGEKARRLLVFADTVCNPPWGSWWHLSSDEPVSRTFTQFRRAINKIIAPHEVDHVEFISEPPENDRLTG